MANPRTPMTSPPKVPETLPALAVQLRYPIVMIAHAAIFALALLSAFLLAYNFRVTIGRQTGPLVWFTELYLPMLALCVPIKLLVFMWAGQYRRSWRYVGLRDLFGVNSAALIGTFFFLTSYFVLENAWWSFYQRTLIDRLPDDQVLRQSSVFALDWAATVVLVSAARVLVRFYYEDIQPQRVGSQRRVLICGAGDAGEAILREMLRMRREGYICLGLLDDDVPELGGRIHDVEIIGRTGDIRAICGRLGVQEVLWALPNAPPRVLRGLVEQCADLGITFRTVPAIPDVIQGRVEVSRIRKVDIEDLLGREPVQLDTEMIGRQLRGRRVLVTGAGGSIGSEMCRQIAAFSPARLVLVEQAENSLFEIDRELRRSFPKVDIVPLVADITDRARIESIFQTHRPSGVFHAAAHKHVPMMECNPSEAIKNNIGGTIIVANACRLVGTEKMVMISTDKAINPSSIMGCTKRVAELYVQGLNALDGTQFVTVRFGNVLGSSGSVVPIFKQQIAAGGPVTVTHPEMTRYFMTIPEAAQLVLQAGTMGKGGEIYILHMGEPVRILDLARDMITLSGLRPGIDIEITFSGIRPGEKLFEELSSDAEDVGDTAHPKIGIWKHRDGDWNQIQQGVEGLRSIADKAAESELRAELKRLVPEYAPECEAVVVEPSARSAPIAFPTPAIPVHPQ
ncbi:MAG: polysaccharide biosynthesis protein [Planctomycetes bacterium]|nr:polysaccharide biosynthesis protein [Planctomycetota bacterium]MBI3835229.1 polysaccharide biosynthesis protein [Planctomycetota bacterium]